MLRAQGWGLREETLGAPAVVQAKDERGVDQAVEGRRGRKALGGFDDKTVRICYALDLGREKQDTRPLPSLLSRAEGRGAGAPWLRGCFVSQGLGQHLAARLWAQQTPPG